MRDLEVELSRQARLPVIRKAAVEITASEGDNGVRSADTPEHPGLFETGTNDGLAARLNDTRPDEQVLAAKLGIAHPRSVPGEVLGFDTDLLGHLGMVGLQGARGRSEERLVSSLVIISSYH